MKTIIVPLDGSALAEQALPLASTIAAKQNAELILTTAIKAGDRWVDDGIVRQWEAEEQAGVEAYVRSTVDKLEEQGIRVRSHVDWGRPQIVIENVADREGADLIVMTTHGRSGVSRWTMGSVADKVLRTTNTPLILIHPTTHAPVLQTVQRIVVALDGSELAEAALPEAERFARTMNASILLVRAVVPPAILHGGEIVPGALPVLDELETEASQYLERTAERVRAHGVEVDLKVAAGIPAEVLLDVANDNGADLIVMTTHGRSGLDRWMFGSVADAVVRHGELPVLVIRSWVSLSEERREAIPVVGDTVVPVPAMTETERPMATPQNHQTETRPHRPERSPGR
jgi:nucleotide-binding universal stress UspA family protein